MIAPPRRGVRLLRPLIFLSFFMGVFYYLISSDVPSVTKNLRFPSTGRMLDIPALPEANTTLGFGAIAAVSRPGSARQQELVLAAQVTGLTVTVPMQPEWTEADLEGIRAKRGSTISRGSALAWLGHQNTLRWFLSTNLTTALILEDDVDWDIHLRTIQVPRVAATTRYLLASDGEKDKTDEEVKRPENEDEYWGSTDKWDVLYLGHCGENFYPGKWNFRVQRAGFYDGTLPRRKDMHGVTKDLLDAIGVPESVRVVHRSIRPLCTFGFALTRHAAERLLNDIAPRERDGGTVAYDVRILEGCRDLGLKCYSTNPELFHHVEGVSEIEHIDEKMNSTRVGTKLRGERPRKGRLPSYEELHMTKEQKAEKARKFREEQRLKKLEDIDEALEKIGGQASLQARDFKKWMKRKRRNVSRRQEVVVKKKAIAGVDQPKAANIACGARMSNVNMNDAATIEYLQEKVGRQGLCIRNLDEEMQKEKKLKEDRERKAAKKKRKNKKQERPETEKRKRSDDEAR
ncbi:Procollagen galactosyltransferase 1 [Elsinoe australis]|uniref:Procollagen galactosyltransferase 1 n=1 Tax=Elsinoe australis TaxID=40998 RepID=A0A2P7YLD1_9PEZI|nr:Procollagen galactosyltransferase 1 [Elsinoe australis]